MICRLLLIVRLNLTAALRCAALAALLHIAYCYTYVRRKLYLYMYVCKSNIFFQHVCSVFRTYVCTRTYTYITLTHLTPASEQVHTGLENHRPTQALEPSHNMAELVILCRELIPKLWMKIYHKSRLSSKKQHLVVAYKALYSKYMYVYTIVQCIQSYSAGITTPVRLPTSKPPVWKHVEINLTRFQSQSCGKILPDEAQRKSQFQRFDASRRRR